MMAHELAHIQNRDTLIMTVTATFAGAISMLAQLRHVLRRRSRQERPAGHRSATLALMILAPLAARLVQMAISRRREYEADRARRRDLRRSGMARLGAGARSTRWRARIDEQRRPSANPATAHMFIINPLHAHAHGQPVLDPSGDGEPGGGAAGDGAGGGLERLAGAEHGAGEARALVLMLGPCIAPGVRGLFRP